MRAGAIRRAVLAAALLLGPHASASGQDVPGELEARARLVPRHEAILSSDMAARILSVEVEPGQRFVADAVLVRLDCMEIAARLRGAEAVLKGAARVAEVRRKLGELGSVSDLDVALAESDAARARADLALYQAQLAKCEIKAPFAGRVVERFAHPAETVGAGQKLLSVLDDRALEIEVLVPSIWLRWLREGHEFEVAVDETGRTYRARVRRMGARVDAVSQSLPIVGELIGPADDLLAGMSGVARFHAGG